MTRPEVVAHRGASFELAEHTLTAYATALEQGADALECDVRLTADGHLVCVHDRDLRRTGNGKGLVSSMELAELSELDFTSWKNPWADLDDEAEERRRDGVLTLRDLLDLAASYERPVELAIETKHPTRYAGLVEKRLVEMLAGYGWAGKQSPVRVMSFSPRALQRVEKLAPDLRLVMLIERKRRWPALKPLLGDDWILGPGIDILSSRKFGDAMERTGRDLHVWTVNTAEQLQVCLDRGVKAVITDRPQFMLKRLRG